MTCLSCAIAETLRKRAFYFVAAGHEKISFKSICKPGSSSEVSVSNTPRRTVGGQRQHIFFVRSNEPNFAAAFGKILALRRANQHLASSAKEVLALLYRIKIIFPNKVALWLVLNRYK